VLHLHNKNKKEEKAMNAPGRNFLLVVGILYVVFGGIAIVTSFAFLATADYWDRTMPITSGMSWSVRYGIALIFALYHIFIGIMGISNRVHIEKAAFLRTLGFIDIVCVIANAVFLAVIWGGIFGGASATFGLIVGLVLPVLYLVGAYKNLSALQR